MWYPDYYDASPTCYLGRRGSARVIRVYDKVARLLAAKRPAPPGPLTRFEAVLRKVSCKPMELATLSNPFAAFGVCEVGELPAKSAEPAWATFLHYAQNLGVPEALQLMGPMRASCIKRLKENMSAWWDSADVWKLYPAVLATIFTF